MKTITVIAILSLAINGALVGYVALRPLAPTKTAKAQNTAVATGSSRAGLSEETKRLLAGNGTENLELLRDRLRAEGLPESVVRSVVEQRLWNARETQINAADPNKKRPWWQQISGRLPGDDVRMARLEEKLQDEVLTKRGELFPDKNEEAHDPSLSFLPASKLQAMQKLHDDYYELHRKLLIESGGAYSDGAYITTADQKKITYLGEEEEKDIRSLLTPAEYDEMKLRSKGNEDSLKKISAILDLSEHEFRGFLEIREWRNQAESKFKPSDDPFAPTSPETTRLQQQIVDEEQQKLNKLLGNDKLQLLKIADSPEYYSVARYVARFDLPQTHIPAYLDLNRKGMDDIVAILQNPTLSPEQRTQSMNALVPVYDASVTKLLGPAALDENFGMTTMLSAITRPGCFSMIEKQQ